MDSFYFKMASKYRLLFGLFIYLQGFSKLLEKSIQK